MLYIGIFILFLAIFSLVSATNRQTAVIEKAADAAAKDRHLAKFGQVPQDVVALAERGDKIGAIRLYRQKTGCDVKVASDVIEEIPRKENPRDLYGF